MIQMMYIANRYTETNQRVSQLVMTWLKELKIAIVPGLLYPLLVPHATELAFIGSLRHLMVSVFHSPPALNSAWVHSKTYGSIHFPKKETNGYN